MIRKQNSGRVRFKYDPSLPLDLTCDFNIDPMCWSVAQNFHPYGYTFKEYTEHTTIIEKVARKVADDFKNQHCKILYLYGDPAGKARSMQTMRSHYDVIYQVFKAAGWDVIRQYKDSQRVTERLNATNKRLEDYANKNEAFEFISSECTELVESIEQTKRKDDGIDKDGMEHHSDAWSYRIAKKHPVRALEHSIV